MRDYLVRLRGEENFSQQKLADSIGITQQYYSLIESGERQQDMLYSTMEKLAAALSVPVQVIIDAESAYRATQQDSA